MKTLKRRIKDSVAYWQVLSRPESTRSYRVSKIETSEYNDLLAAKRLHAEIYLAKGFVSHRDIKEDIIHERSDPHQKHADYFIVKRRNDVIAIARQITYKGSGQHHESFPVLNKAIIYERSRNRILNYHPTEIVEISALVKKGGESSVAPLLLYRALWQHSLSSEHRIWIMACDVRLYERLKLLFGPALTRIGQRTPYQGADVIPVALNINSAYKYVQKAGNTSRTGIFDIKRRAAKFILGKI